MKNKIRVLIIEDNKDDSVLEIDEIKRGGFDIIFERIETRVAMRAALKNKHWDFIISDYSLPQFSGLDALEELKQSGIDIPFVLISGTIGEETAVAAMKAGAHDYIMKNNLSRLVPAFERELKEAAIRHEKRRADDALKSSMLSLKKQITEYKMLNNQYLKINKELKDRVDQIKKMNSELYISKNKAEESDKLKSAFLANMSHEIRTPLNGILGFSSLLNEPNLTKEDKEDYIEIINSNGQQLLTIINDILDISKIEAGQVSIHYEAVNISEMMNGLKHQFKDQAALKNLVLTLNQDFTGEEIILYTDANRLRQVFLNLISNAIKFTHTGGIEFGYIQKENFLEFYVKDTGIGIALEDQSIIFKPFRKVEDSLTATYGGTGLGLPISKALVEKLGGSLTLKSKKNSGSVFVFTIPQHKEATINI
jgi:signal transduction histidine kinase